MLLKISQNLQENNCAWIFFSIILQASACNFIKKETLVQVFSCEFCEFFKNVFLTEHLLETASVVKKIVIDVFFDWRETLSINPFHATGLFWYPLKTFYTLYYSYFDHILNIFVTLLHNANTNLIMKTKFSLFT